MTASEKLREKLLKTIKYMEATPCSIVEKRSPNPFPGGLRSVYVFATQGKATASFKWKLLEFFEQEEKGLRGLNHGIGESQRRRMTKKK